MQATDYQQRCVDAIINGMQAGHQAQLCDLFTGAGKTVIFALLAREMYESKVLVLCHQRELVWQAADKMDAVAAETPGVEMAEWHSHRGRVTVACTPTLLRGRYRKFLGHQIIIVDEAHRQMSAAVLAMLREFQENGGYVVGFTATPFRMDGKKLRDFYSHHAFSMGFRAGIDEGYCLDLRAKIVKCDYLDLKRVRVVGKDYSASDLDMILGCSRAYHQMCLTVQKHRQGPALAFLPGVKSAMGLAELAEREYGIKAAFVCGDTRVQSEDERNLVIGRFRRGEIDLLCNCQVAAEGFDAPVAQTVFMFRPTRSRVMALQIWGRVMRPLPGTVHGLATAEERLAAIAASGKDHCRVIDITDSLNDHSIVTAVDMFAKEDTPDDVRREARERAADNDDAESAEDMLAQAAEKLRQAKLLEEGLALLHGQAEGRLRAEEVSVTGRKKCISEYKVPIRGRFAGRTMGELDDGFIDWALRNPGIKGWQRSYFVRERQRRRSVAKHVG